MIALEVVGVSERLERMRRENRHAFADILVRNALSFAGEHGHAADGPGADGALADGRRRGVLVDWVNGDVDAPVEEIVEHFTRMFTAVAEASVAPHRGQ